ncbi:MAG: N(4)-(beta-N-acetylglucosaminyl)-L-asparaginase [Gemmatimonadetes bacterium]|nr:N(4)-(beta-N-acetylglucosaminyl)-L-asparaginase [Gemmatimonadota bacterium]MYD13330.1 N(4)-(beta-N-acetylglucosaminyl)-L-asparaginase [Gemmatimonadota bacterium]MYI66115.1 N(4)-(beta-N-acetylglucosaminyl)-L-asparaginase [Gemmatimonadota bacterium]
MTSRRDFLKTSAGVGVGAAVGMGSASPLLGAPAIRRSVVTPVAVGSGNALEASATAIEVVNGGGDTLEGVVQGVNIVERDPGDSSVGYGGLPNLDGVVQLDSSVMHGPSRGAGAVACLEGIKTPSSVAMDVMRYTDHVLLVGKGAQRFAVSMGYQTENLLTERSRRRWIEWRARMSDTDDYLVPDTAGPGGEPFEDEEAYGLGILDSHDGVRPQGTINCNVVNRDGDLSGVTTTSGLAWKVPGRVGDSPIVGAGLYVDNDVGACGSTGRGEAVIKTCGSHTVVEMMRAGMSPTDACLEALRRIVTFTVEPRLRNDRGLPGFNVNYYAVNKNGEYGGAAIWSGARFAVCVDGEARREESAYLYER